jgi:hypothetical protein
LTCRRTGWWQSPPETRGHMLARLRHVPFLLALVTASSLARPTGAQIVLDQRFDPGALNTLAEVDEIIDHAQTFTVGVLGALTGLDLLLCRGFNTTQPLLVDIRRTFGGIPAESDTDPTAILASAVVPASRIDTKRPLGPGASWVHIDFAGLTPLVSPGDVLAVVLRPSDPFALGADDGFGWGGQLVLQRALREVVSSGRTGT